MQYSIENTIHYMKYIDLVYVYIVYMHWLEKERKLEENNWSWKWKKRWFSEILIVLHKYDAWASYCHSKWFWMRDIKIKHAEIEK